MAKKKMDLIVKQPRSIPKIKQLKCTVIVLLFLLREIINGGPILNSRVVVLISQKNTRLSSSSMYMYHVPTHKIVYVLCQITSNSAATCPYRPIYNMEYVIMNATMFLYLRIQFFTHFVILMGTSFSTMRLNNHCYNFFVDG